MLHSILIRTKIVPSFFKQTILWRKLWHKFDPTRSRLMHKLKIIRKQLRLFSSNLEAVFWLYCVILTWLLQILFLLCLRLDVGWQSSNKKAAIFADKTKNCKKTFSSENSRKKFPTHHQHFLLFAQKREHKIFYDHKKILFDVFSKTYFSFFFLCTLRKKGNCIFYFT